MENINIKCSSKKHSEIDAICYCQECKIYLCNKCQSHHLELFENHLSFNIDKNINIKNIFTGYCKEKNHSNILEYFCKTHNILCCVECVCKIKEVKKGHHSDCDICTIEKIKDEKRNNLKENIKKLEDLSKSLNDSIIGLKKILEKINENKEKIKFKIQNIFTQIRNALNEREDELLNQVDKEYNNLFINENKLKEYEKMPNKIKISLEKGNNIDKEWNNEKLSSMINDCISIENNIKDINLIHTNIKKYNLNENKEIKFTPEENEINKYLDTIKNLGKIYYNINLLKFKWKTGPNYTLSNNDLIATKTNGGNKYNCNILGDIILPKDKINKWKIKLQTFSNPSNNGLDILIGVGPSNLNQNGTCLYNKTWTFICGYSLISIKSGSAKEYNGHNGKLKEGDIVEVIMNTINGELSFSVNDNNYGIACKIPLDIDLSPFISIYDQGDSVEVINEIN